MKYIYEKYININLLYTYTHVHIDVEKCHQAKSAPVAAPTPNPHMEHLWLSMVNVYMLKHVVWTTVL